jgi:NADH-quinone oxidoreductase subunit E
MFTLSEEGLAFVKKELGRYETKKSAIIPCLYRAQTENGGHITPEVIDYLSQVMGLPVADIHEVFTFYSMFNKKPVGKYHIQVCCNLSCAMNGGREMTDHILDQLRIEDGQVTADGKYSVSRVECLGSCGTAPMMQINDKYFEGLTNGSAMDIIRGLE